jgi:hypothetical protein
MIWSLTADAAAAWRDAQSVLAASALSAALRMACQ